MANENRFGQKGVSSDLQFGKRGPKLVANATTSAMQVMAVDGTTLANMRIADGVVSTDAVTKGQLDASVSNVTTNAYNITLGTGGDGSFTSPGAVTSLTGSTSVSESIDRLNETKKVLKLAESIPPKTYELDGHMLAGPSPRLLFSLVA